MGIKIGLILSLLTGIIKTAENNNVMFNYADFFDPHYTLTTISEWPTKGSKQEILLSRAFELMPAELKNCNTEAELFSYFLTEKKDTLNRLKKAMPLHRTIKSIEESQSFFDNKLYNLIYTEQNDKRPSNMSLAECDQLDNIVKYFDINPKIITYKNEFMPDDMPNDESGLSTTNTTDNIFSHHSLLLTDETKQQMHTNPDSFLWFVAHELTHAKYNDFREWKVLNAAIPSLKNTTVEVIPSTIFDFKIRNPKLLEEKKYKLLHNYLQLGEHVADIANIVNNNFNADQRLFLYQGGIKETIDWIIKEDSNENLQKESYWELTPEPESTHPKNVNRLQVLARAYQLAKTISLKK